MRNRLSVTVLVLLCVVFSFLSFVIPVRAQFTHRYIVKNTTDTFVAGACGNGSGNSTADCSLRGAILAVNAIGSGDISFAIPASDPSCVAGACTINLTSALPALGANNTFIIGPGPDRLTVRRTGASGNYRIFNVAATGTVGISGITVTNGISSSNGGGISNGTGTLNIANSTISNNQANGTVGGGIANFGGTLNVTNSTISGNTVVGLGSGGGIFSVSGATLTVTNCTIRGNFGGTGGGIFNGGAAGTSVANVINSTLNQNFSSIRGGAIFNDSILNLTNSTLSGNFITGASGDSGGGVYNAGTALVRSNIIALNTGPQGPDVNGSFVSAGFNLIGETNGSNGFPAATDQTGVTGAPLDPILDPAGLQNNGGPTLTIALLLGSPAIDKGTSAGLIGNLTSDQRGTGFRRTFDIPAVANAAGENGTDIGAYERQSKAPADFDGDGKTDIGIFRPAGGASEWWINRSSTGVTFALQFGASTDRITPADYTGDGKADIAFFRPASGEWYVLRSEDFSFFALPFGTNGDVPVPADYDADGKADFAVFRPSSATWFISQSSGAPTQIVQFGINGDQPVVSDYDGDGKADVAIFRPGPREWWIQRSTAGLLAMQFGNTGDKVVQGDYTGDGKADIAIWRPSNGQWLIVRSENLSFFGFPFGTTGDTVAPGDYDGDGKFDATVFRPSSATWFIARSTAGTQIVQFGATGDRPIPNSFVP